MQRFISVKDYSFLPHEQIHDLQEKLFRELVAHCKQHSPFYSRLLGDCPADLKLEDIKALPTTSKDDLAKHNQDFIAVPPNQIADICFTSGTTGIPCKITYTRRDLERLAYNDAVGFKAAGMASDDIVLMTCTIDRCFIAGLAYYQGVVKLGAAAIRNGLNTMDSHAEIIKSTRPTAVVGVPSFIAKLGQFLATNGIDGSCIKHIVCIGEALRTREMSLTPLGELLEQFWPGAVFSTYASSEIATSFTECEQRHGGHPPVDLAVVEILDEQGNPLPPGSIGEVTVTTLQVEGMPLIRFRTGDIGFQLPEPCPCGRHSLRLGPILGRKAQMLKVRGTTLFPNAFFHILDEIPQVDNYYMEVRGDSLSDEIDLYVSLKEGTLESLRIQDKLHARNRIHARIHQVSPEQAQKKVFGTSRKPVRFFDLR